MYGYIRPCVPQLRVVELERYRSVYCGVCFALKHGYGQTARLCLSYDSTLPALLLCGDNGGQPRRCRCVVHPTRKICVAGGDYSAIADTAVILAYWSARDKISDRGAADKAKGAAARVALSRSYKKAARRRPEFADTTKDLLDELSILEHNRCPSLDRAADCFARITQAMADIAGDTAHSRIYKELFYHIGRFIYIADAIDDYADDVRRGQYNPIAAGLPDAQPILSGDIKQTIRQTAEQSMAAAAMAYELLPSPPDDSLIRNILYLGLPHMLDSILSDGAKDRKQRI